MYVGDTVHMPRAVQQNFLGGGENNGILHTKHALIITHKLTNNDRELVNPNHSKNALVKS
jgi:hypothetical protein